MAPDRRDPSLSEIINSARSGDSVIVVSIVSIVSKKMFGMDLKYLPPTWPLHFCTAVGIRTPVIIRRKGTCTAGTKVPGTGRFTA